MPVPPVRQGKVGLDPSTPGEKDHEVSEQAGRVRLACLSQDQDPGYVSPYGLGPGGQWGGGAHDCRCLSCSHPLPQPVSNRRWVSAAPLPGAPSWTDP